MLLPLVPGSKQEGQPKARITTSRSRRKFEVAVATGGLEKTNIPDSLSGRKSK